MDEKSIIIVLRNIFGSYANRILSGINLVQKSMKENYQMVLKFSKDHSVIWSKFLDASKSDIIDKSTIYTIYKPLFPTTKIKFTKTSDQSTITRSINILSIEEKEKEAICSMAISYIDIKEYNPEITLELVSIHKVMSKHIILHGWDISTCSYVYGKTLDDKRLINGPVDRTDVECVYVGNPKTIRENFLRLLALIDEKYDYKNILLQASMVNVSKKPTILTNRLMNTFDIHECKVFKSPSTKFVNIITYENLWLPMDVVITQDHKEIYCKTFKADSMTKFYTTVIHQAICAFKNDKYYILDGSVPLEETSLFIQMEEMDTSSYDTWGDIIDEYDLFSVIHNGNYYYFNKSIVINYAVNSSYKSTSLWNFLLPTMEQNYPCTLQIKCRDGKYYDTSVVEDPADTEEIVFDKLCATYSNKYDKIIEPTKFSSIVRLMYQYISENVFTKRPRDSIIHIFDTQSIGSVELVKFCKTNKLILVGKKQYVVEYFEKIVKDTDVGILYSSSIVNDQMPKIEVVNTCKQDFAESLIKETSFINNTIDIIYLQNNFTTLNTFPKIIQFAQNILKILSKRGRLYVNFFNLTLMNRSKLNITTKPPQFTLHDVPESDIKIINNLFEPNAYTRKLGKFLEYTKNLIIEKDIDNIELEEIYNVRKKFEDNYTVIATKMDISMYGFYEKYKFGKIFLYVIFPRFENKLIEGIVKEVVDVVIKNHKDVIETFTNHENISYYAIDPILFSVFGDCTDSIFPYKTRVLGSLISQNPNYLFVVDAENENIFSNMQLNIY